MGIASDITYIVIAAMCGGVLAHLLKQPLILGYIFAGILVGPYTAGPSVEGMQNIELLAEIGVALLLFTLGLEFSFGELKRLMRLTCIGTPIQIVLSSICGALIARTLGLSLNESIWIGGAFSLSSTMVVLKTLAAKDALHSRTGRIMLSMLVAQDLAIVPLMLILPQLTGDSNFGLLFLALLKSLVFLAGMYIAGTRIFPALFTLIARWGSRELFFLLTLGVALGAGIISHYLGLSFALGAFVAGMLLSETDYNHQALSDISGLRDLFGLIFFVSVGMLFNPSYFFTNFGLVAGLTFLFILSKALVLIVILRGLQIPLGRACAVGFGLSQIGEFSFVIANVGHRSGALSAESHSLMIAVAVLSMVLTPSLWKLGIALKEHFREHTPLPQLLGDNEVSILTEHVVILGGGSVGQYVAQTLQSLGRPVILIDSNIKVVTQLRDRNIPIVFGDCTHYEILKAAGVAEARLIIVATTNEGLLPTILEQVRQLNQKIPIVVRWENEEQSSALDSFNIHEIVQPQKEVGLEMIHQALITLDAAEGEVFAILGQLRNQRSEALLRQTGFNLAHASRLLEFSWQGPIISGELLGKTLKASNFRERYGLSIVALMNDNEFMPTPGPETVIVPGALLGVIGSKRQIDKLTSDLAAWCD